jgi:hypothetical protein
MLWTATMLKPAAMALAVLAAPGVCPKEFGQIHWDGFQHAFSDGGHKWTLQVSIWDHDTDAKPSDGDIVRINQAQVDGRDAGLDEAWFVMGGGLAQDFAAAFKKQQLTSTCESHFKADGLPKLKSAHELGRFLAGLSHGGGGTVDPEAEVRGDLSAFADQLCQGKRHISKDDLENQLLRHALAGHAGVAKGRLRDIAHAVAEDKALSCARLDGGGYTF